MALRALHYGLGPELAAWVLLFADDGKATIEINRLRPTLKAMFALLSVLGFPIKWTKVRGGPELQWIGYLVNLRLGKVDFHSPEGLGGEPDN